MLGMMAMTVSLDECATTKTRIQTYARVCCRRNSLRLHQHKTKDPEGVPPEFLRYGTTYWQAVATIGYSAAEQGYIPCGCMCDMGRPPTHTHPA